MNFAIVADDDTGASDAASMLTGEGVRTVLLLDYRRLEEDRAVLDPFDAIVVGTQTRAVRPAAARERTRAALEALQPYGPRQCQIKYCSTFDSTRKGNIGPSLDAAIECLDVEATIVCPALPVNGRTTYNGYHFVHGALLSESPLRDHPLNPMTDANLVRWLQYQTDHKVVSVHLRDVRKGPESLGRHMEEAVSAGACYLVTDAVQQSDLTTIAEATRRWPLISGGSGITAEVPRFLFPERSPLSFEDRVAAAQGPLLVVSGSCSPATRGQDEYALGHGFAEVRVDPVAVLSGEFDAEEVSGDGLECLRARESVVVRASGGPDSSVGQVQEAGRSLGLSEEQVGERIGEALAAVARRLVASDLVGRLAVSGGETAGTVCRALEVRALEVGLPIEPGVPYCFPLARPELLVVLKSGNFGSEDFYERVRRLSA
ncbi:MAG: four-carbon acid sugar kinase family protein [Candidatus Brocadiaceae bacterium]